jgi:hypothetical protein
MSAVLPLSRICVFCGSNSGAHPDYAVAAAALGQLLAQRGITLVYGGGNVGLMGILADACMTAGGQVIGVIPEALVRREVAHHHLTELRVVDSMHTRKAMMADLSDAFIALPGGVGTFEELFEIWTWSQLGIHRKPCGLLNVRSYYDPLIALTSNAVREKFMRPEHRDIFTVESDPALLLGKLQNRQPPLLSKWIDRDQR